MKLLLLSFLLVTGCAPSVYNIIDLTDDQWVEDAQGERCIEKQMIITEDHIVYLYSNCPIRRVVKPKPHFLPPPPPKPHCDGPLCSP